MRETFGERLKNLRKSLGLTQTQLSEKLNVHLQTVSKWERDMFEPDIAVLGDIANLFGISIEKLCGIEESDEVFTGVFDAVAFGRTVAEGRKAQGKSQEALATELGVNSDTVSKWERGVTCPDVDGFLKLAECFKMTPSKLYFGITQTTQTESVNYVRKRKTPVLVWLLSASLVVCIAAMLAIFLPLVSTQTYSVTVTGSEELHYSVNENDWFMPQTPVKSGYDFVGFRDETGNEVTFSQKIKGDTTYTAVFQPHEYVIDYWTNGGTFSGPVANSFTVENIELVLPLPVKNGAVFEGWYESPDYSGEKTAFWGWFDSADGGTRYETVGGENVKNITLYALWQESDVKTSISYVLNGGTLPNENPTVMGEGDQYILESPQKKGYDFIGWNDQPDGNGRMYSELKNLTEDLTLYALYRPHTYVIIYEYEGVYMEAANPSFVVYGETYTLSPVALGGYQFVGWFDKKEGGNKVERIDESNVTELTKLYARYEPIEYVIRLDAGDGRFESPEGSNQTYDYTVPFGEKLILPDCVREGYDFMGWIDENGDAISEITVINIRNMTLTAVYRDAIGYPITYVLSGGEATGHNPETAYYGQSAELHAAEKQGYLFLGWNDDPDGEGKYYDCIPGDIGAPLTLYAIWQEIIINGSSENFLYEKGAQSVTITRYTGSYGKNVNVTIPAFIEGLPVTKIEGTGGGFPIEGTEENTPVFSAKETLNSVIILEGIVELGYGVFPAITVNIPIAIPASVVRIGNGCFEYFSCSASDHPIEFATNSRLEYIGENAFGGLMMRGVLVLPTGLKTIDIGAFAEVCAMGIVIPNTVEYIMDAAFNGELSKIYLPDSIKYVGSNFFQDGEATHVYTSLNKEQTAGFAPDWCEAPVTYNLRDSVVTLTDGAEEKQLVGKEFVLPKTEKSGFTFWGWRETDTKQFASPYYIPARDVRLEAVYEEKTKNDGRSPSRPFLAEGGESFEVSLLSGETFYFVPNVSEKCKVKIYKVCQVSLRVCKLTIGGTVSESIDDYKPGEIYFVECPDLYTVFSVKLTLRITVLP